MCSSDLDAETAISEDEELGFKDIVVTAAVLHIIVGVQLSEVR